MARRRHGVVTRQDLLDAGLSPSGIDRRVDAGRLHRMHEGVYAVGHDGLTPEGRWLAGVLACGIHAVLSHESAAGLWRMGGILVVPVHVTLIMGNRRSRPGLRVHRPRSLDEEEVTTHNGIRVTTPLRTIQDLRFDPAVVNDALVKRLIRPADVDAPSKTRSNAERRFLRLCRAHGVSRPEVNVVIEGYECDFVWRAKRLIAEVDGPHHEATRHADYARDRHLTLAGWRVLRFPADGVDGAMLRQLPCDAW
jgi:very-short-patch-repair endonuclease